MTEVKEIHINLSPGLKRVYCRTRADKGYLEGPGLKRGIISGREEPYLVSVSKTVSG